MEDKILRMFFDIGRWERAIDKGVDKDIRKDQLIRLTDERTRMAMADAMRRGNYEISPPHTAQIPKENGEFRTVYVNEPIDRVVLSIANDLLFDLMPEMIHPACKSYQRGIGCGKVVREVSDQIVEAAKAGCMGWKADLSKYFDSVPIAFVDAAFDKVEARHGHSALIDVLRKYYHSDLYFDQNNELHSQYQSLKQGCAVASWLANVLLYELDEELSRMNGYYVRYSDDMLFIGEDYQRAMSVLERRLEAMSMKLNPQEGGVPDGRPLVQVPRFQHPGEPNLALFEPHQDLPEGDRASHNQTTSYDARQSRQRREPLPLQGRRGVQLGDADIAGVQREARHRRTEQVRDGLSAGRSDGQAQTRRAGIRPDQGGGLHRPWPRP